MHAHRTLTTAPRRMPLAAALSLILMGLAPQQLSWAATDISEVPLINAQVSVKPNLMFILDNSGSMNYQYLPDGISDRNKYGIWSSQCNGTAFNPSSTNAPYTLPITADGRSYPAMDLRAAWSDGFQPTFLDKSYSITASLNTQTPEPSTSTVLDATVSVTIGRYDTANAVGDKIALYDRASGDVSHWMVGTITSVARVGSTRTYNYGVRITFSSFRNNSVSSWTFGQISTVDLLATDNSPRTDYFYTYTGSQTAMSWAYTSTGAFDTSSTFVSQCRSDIGSSPGSSVFSQTSVSGLSTADKQRYANWYSYYRSRILMMRSAAGRAMWSLDNRYRVGFSTINDSAGDFNTSVTASIGSFSDVGDFTSTKKIEFFSNLYGAPVGGSTPLRRALAKVGRYYGNKFSGQVDPIQNACQRNYSLLTTDGYWNESTLPTQLNGTTAVGDQDNILSATPRPQYDGGQNYTRVYDRTNYVVASTCSGGKRYTPYTERRTETTTPTGTVDSGWSAVAGTSGSNTNCRSSAPAPTSETLNDALSSGGPAPNTLADVAAYYYYTDLRSDLIDSVPYVESDPNRKQHMTTYTLGLGLSGNLRYADNYLSGGSADYTAIKNGSLNWPIPPLDDSSNPSKIDDLWHAAVNGHGRYFSTSDANNLTNALTTALSDITARDGAGASAASTSLRPVLGTDQVFIASYRTQSWNGELEARTITQDPVTRAVSIAPENRVWQASSQLDARTYSARTIYYLRKTTTASVTTPSRGTFTYTNLGTDTDGTTLTGYFDNYCGKTPVPTQCSVLTSGQRTAASGEALVNFIRGDRTNEGSLYRSRRSVLGDMVDASPVFVGRPPFLYTGSGYPDFAANQVNRCPVVYAAANDGMLHAFSAKLNRDAYASCPTAGSEMWAYIPRSVMSRLYMLADTDYANQHRFYVNASPILADVSSTSGTTTTWKTIVVGGLGGGGKAYYALDVTDPTNPQPLWEFTDTDLGLSYGNPVITQVRDSSGTLVWAVVFTSGHNNTGNGYLYVLNAITGAQMYKVPTLISGNAVSTSAADPSGLNKLNAWLESPSDNVASRFYAVDLKGNVWRFDANNLAAPASGTDNRSVRLAQLVKSSAAQPITTKPELAEVQYGGSRYPVVLVGTGRYLGASDVLDRTASQTIYGIKDPLTSSGWSDARGSMVAQTMTTSANGQSRTISNNPVDWSNSLVAGWYVDMPDAGERVAVNMSLAYTTLTVPSVVPSDDACTGSGYSWIYNLDIATGSYTVDQATTQLVGYRRSVATMGINTLQAEGQTSSTQIITNADGSADVAQGASVPTGTGSLRRTSWRELTP